MELWRKKLRTSHACFYKCLFIERSHLAFVLWVTFPVQPHFQMWPGPHSVHWLRFMVHYSLYFYKDHKKRP